VGDVGLFGVQFQADPGQPLGDHGLEMVKGIEVVVQDHNVVGEADHARLGFAGSRLTHGGFQSV
jgi:hypothetical protein